jgi:hypothetical protein
MLPRKLSKMSSPTEHTGLLKLAYSPWDYTNTVSSFRQDPKHLVRYRRLDPNRYQSDWLQKIRQPFGIQNSMFDGRGSGTFGILNEANDWINPLAYGSRAIEDTGHMFKNMGNTLDTVGHNLRRGEIGQAIGNTAKGTAQTGLYGGAALGMGAMAYQMRHTPLAFARHGASLAAGAGTGLYTGARNLGGWFTGSANKGKSIVSEANKARKYVNQGIIDNTKNMPWLAGKSRNIKPDMSWKDALKNLRKARQQGKFTDVWRARGKALKAMPGWIKWPGTIALAMGAFATSGAARRDMKQQEAIWNDWDKQDYRPNTNLMSGIGGMLAAAPRQFGSMLGGGQSNNFGWYK